MKRVVRLLALTMIAALACVARASSEPATGFVQVAQSPLLTVEGAVTADTLVLRLRRTADQQPVADAQLALNLDGRSRPLTVRPEGTWGVPLKDVTVQPGGRLAIVVTHDGVREELDGKLPGGAAAPPASGSGGLLSTLMHKQMAWWVLNVVIVLIGVIAVSRHTSGGG